MGTGVAGFSVHKNLGELASPGYDDRSAYVSAATKQARAVANLGITASIAQINAAADLSANTTVVAAGGGAVTPTTGGGTYLIPLVTANVTMTLPATPTLGERHELIFMGTAADAEDWVITAAAFFVSGPAFFDVGGTNAVVYANGTTHNTMTVNNPAGGTRLLFIGNGTNWVAAGVVSSADAYAFTAV